MVDVDDVVDVVVFLFFALCCLFLSKTQMVGFIQSNRRDHNMTKTRMVQFELNMRRRVLERERERERRGENQRDVVCAQSKTHIEVEDMGTRLEREFDLCNGNTHVRAHRYTNQASSKQSFVLSFIWYFWIRAVLLQLM